jgi:putative membrane protein
MAHRVLLPTIPVLAPAFVASAHAHDSTQAASVAFGFELAIGACLLAALVLYAIGIARMWRRSGIGRGIRLPAAGCYLAGSVVLAAGLFGPLDVIAQRSFAAHMIQHELLMVVAAPLLVLGRALGAWSWAFAPRARRRIGAALRMRWVASVWRVLTVPLAAWCLHTIALWMWHAPVLFRAASADAALHMLQHASFLLTALLFWWAVIRNAVSRPLIALILLFTTMVHTGALGALLVFAATDWYASDVLDSSRDDQQLGGLIMWVPAGAVYLMAALAVAGRLLEPVRRAHTNASGRVVKRAA